MILLFQCFALIKKTDFHFTCPVDFPVKIYKYLLFTSIFDEKMAVQRDYEKYCRRSTYELN
ncbi:MAG: hypothetical protein EA393_06130 [Bacteroidetes bacterium]|nr:MAG: hypothetical protein EA393_06130 [Bacteroidota bacterium]